MTRIIEMQICENTDVWRCDNCQNCTPCTYIGEHKPEDCILKQYKIHPSWHKDDRSKLICQMVKVCRDCEKNMSHEEIMEYGGGINV